MATTIDVSEGHAPPSLMPDRFERLLAVAAILLLAAMAAAIMRGQARWAEASGMVWFHLATIGVALALTPVMLLRPRGDRPHRVMGWIWSAALIATALGTFAIRQTNHGHFSFIHILSVWMLYLVPKIVWPARTHNIRVHRSSVRGAVFGALLIAGYFTFPFHRMLGNWLFG